MHHVKANGERSPKVFKGWAIELVAGESRTPAKQHLDAHQTTRRYHAGRHAIDLRINGEIVAEAEFDLKLDVQANSAAQSSASKPTRSAWLRSSTGRRITLGCSSMSAMALAASVTAAPALHRACASRPCGEQRLPAERLHPRPAVRPRHALLLVVVEDRLDAALGQPCARSFDGVAVRDAVQDRFIDAAR